MRRHTAPLLATLAVTTALAVPGSGQAPSPTVDPELGGAVGFDEESIQRGVEGVFNVLRYYDFLNETVEPQSQTRAGGFEQYGSPVGGIVDFQVELGEEVSASTPLFAVTDVFGNVKTEVTADSSGIVWRTRRRPPVASGEYVCSLGTDIDTY